MKKRRKKKKKKTNREEKPADVFLTDFCSHNIESRRVIVSSSERWKNIIIPILKDASDPAGLGLLGQVRSDGSLASILAPPSASDLSCQHIPLIHPILVHLNSKYDDWRAYRTQLVALYYFFYLSEQCITLYFNKKRIVFSVSNIKSSMLINFACQINFEKLRRKKTQDNVVCQRTS